MRFRQTQKSKSQNSQTSESSSFFPSRPFPLQRTHRNKSQVAGQQIDTSHAQFAQRVERAKGQSTWFGLPRPSEGTGVRENLETGLPSHIKNGVESLAHIPLDNVKVHLNSSEPARVNALAYTQGTNIYVAPGQEKHLPHEAWHVVQQAQGRVKPTAQMENGVSINNDAGLEREADGMGNRISQMASSASSNSREPGFLGHNAPGQTSGIVQRITAHDGKIWSTFLEKVWIDDKQAVITAGSADSLTGGHAFVILEFVHTDGLAHAVRIDLFVNQNNEMLISIKNRQTETGPTMLDDFMSLMGVKSELSVEGNLENPGIASSHIIVGSKAGEVLAAAAAYQNTINTNYYYSTTGYGLPGFLTGETRTAINCAWFAGMLLEIGGVAGKASVVPSLVAGAKSSQEETNARFTLT